MATLKHQEASIKGLHVSERTRS